MTTYRPGDRVPFRFRWIENGDVATGLSVDVWMYRGDPDQDDLEYLQSDKTSWSTTRHKFSLDDTDLDDEDSEFYEFYLEMPSSADGDNITVVADPNQSPFTTQEDGPHRIVSPNTGDTDLDVQLRP